MSSKCISMQKSTVSQIEEGCVYGEDRERDRCCVAEELIEGQARERRAYYDVRRVSHHRGDPTNVRGENLRNDKRDRVNAQAVKDLDGQGHDEKGNCHN